jgi:hypothetical protein
MDQMMSGEMWGTVVAGFILLVLVVLVIAALVKFVFFR